MQILHINNLNKNKNIFKLFCQCTSVAATAAMILCLHCGVCGSIAAAQTKVKLIISEQLIITPNRPIPLPIQYEKVDKLPPQTFIRIKNLPPKTTLTEGYQVSGTTWAIPLDRRLQVLLRYVGKTPVNKTVNIQLVSLEGEVHAEATMRLISIISPVTPPTLASRSLKRESELRQQAEDVMSATSDLSIGNTPNANGRAEDDNDSSQSNIVVAVPAQAALTSSLSPEDQLTAQRFVAKGNEFLLQGNVNTARLFYRRAADLGFADAAMALAATFDPNELSGLGIVGVQGDTGQALRWYKHAAEQGDPIAVERMKRLLK